MRRRYQVLAVGVAVVGAAGWYVAYGPDALVGRVTAYDATCLSKTADGQCMAIGWTLEPTVFEVSVDSQLVHVLRTNGDRVALRECVVTSKAEWHCRSTDGAAVLGFKDGRPWARLPDSAVNDLVSLPRWRYLWLKISETRRPLMPTRFELRP